jgi:transcription initiation factor IIE alpha subunit
MHEDINEEIGAAAAKVWKYLRENGQASASTLSEGVGLDKNDVQRALGWLAREGKIAVARKGTEELICLVF